MKKFLIGIAAGLILAGFIVFTLVLVALSLGERKPTIPSGATLVVRLEGEVPEKPGMELPFPGLAGQSPATLQEIWGMFRQAASDERIEAIALFPGSVQVGWGKLQELRGSIVAFKESGKPVVAYLRHPSAAAYYLASGADAVYMQRDDMLDLKGLRVESMFVKQTLDKLGVEVEIEHAGKYKNAGDMFTRTSMTPETREVLESVVDELYSHLLETFAEARGKSPEEIRTALDDGPFLGSQAHEAGLIDDLLYEDEFYDLLKERLEQDELKKISHTVYLKDPQALYGSRSGDQIAFIVGEGSIISGEGGDGFDASGILGSRDFIRTLRTVAKNDKIKGAILRIDSPGGDAIASDEILREVRLLSRKKPLVISMSDVAASGGYYIAMTGDPVIAHPYTFTGSIGVIYGKINLRGLYDKLGIQKESITRGRFANIDSDYEPLNDAGRKKLKEGITAVYESFLAVVSEGRDKPVDQIRPLAEGRVWLGVQAHRNGLVDEVGGLDKAIALIKDKAGLSVEDEVRLVPYPRKQNLLEYFLNQSDESVVRSEIRRLLNGIDPLVFHRGGILRLMPYSVSVR